MQVQGLQFEMVCSTKTGLIRDNNEDNFSFLGRVMPQDHQSVDGLYSSKGECARNVLVGVFDGMGGHAKGELASYVAAKALSEIAGKGRKDPWMSDELAQLLRDLNAVVLRAGEEARATNTGSTATLLTIDATGFRVANLGDSPAFLFRDGQMRELTERHTDENLMRELGIVGGHPRLVQYLGVPESEFVLEPHVAREQAMDGDVVMLCTDGITDMVDDADIQAAVGDGTNLRRTYTRLRDATLAAGARDNFTILLCRFSCAAQKQ